MAFNLGKTRLKGFNKMFKAIKENRPDDVIKEMKNSTWHKQVKGRAESLERQMSYAYFGPGFDIDELAGL